MIEAIRHEYENTQLSREELSIKHGVTHSFVYWHTKNIKKSIKGKHKGVKSNNRSLSADTIVKIKQRLLGDTSQKDIAREFNTTPSTISQIKTLKIYAETKI